MPNEYKTTELPSGTVIMELDRPAPPAPPTLSKGAFMDLFTPGELTGIYTAAKVSVDVEVWLDRFKVAEYIDVSDPRTVAGVQSLETAGLLAAGRAAQILV